MCTHTLHIPLNSGITVTFLTALPDVQPHHYVTTLHILPYSICRHTCHILLNSGITSNSIARSSATSSCDKDSAPTAIWYVCIHTWHILLYYSITVTFLFSNSVVWWVTTAYIRHCKVVLLSHQFKSSSAVWQLFIYIAIQYVQIHLI